VVSNWDVPFNGASLGLASRVAMQLLAGGLTYDHTCLLVGQIQDGRIAKVEDEELKLKAADASGKICRVGVAPDVGIGNAADYPKLEIRRMRTIDEAVEYASGLVGQVERVLQGEVKKVVADAGTRMGRGRRRGTEGADARIQDWEDLKRLNVPVKVARGIRPFLKDDEVRELEQRRSLGDYSRQNRVDQERRDLRGEEAQERLPRGKRRQTVQWESIRGTMDHAVVTGDPGYGKTMLSWLEMEENRDALAQLQTQRQSIREIRFSIWMRAAELAARTGATSAIDAIVEDLTALYALKPDGQAWLQEQLANGHGHIVLDALDEVPVSDRENLDRALHRLPSAARILLTSRLEGYAGAPFTLPKDNEVEVLAFEDRAMEEAIRNWFDAARPQQADPEEEARRQSDMATARALRAHIQEHWMVREILHCPCYCGWRVRRQTNSKGSIGSCPDGKREPSSTRPFWIIGLER
jgi:hypothetical protein